MATNANEEASKKKKGGKGADSDSDSLDELEEDVEDNTFEVNEVFNMRSKINNLEVEKERQAIAHQKQAIEHADAMKKQEAKNLQLKRENTRLQDTISKLQKENDELRLSLETRRHEAESLNRKTADFHHSYEESSQLHDPAGLLPLILKKDEELKDLRLKIAEAQRLSSRQSVESKTTEKD
jgi:hypothetical protein